MSPPASAWATNTTSWGLRASSRALELAPIVAAVAIAWSVASSAAHLMPTVGGIELTSWLFLVLAGGGLTARAFGERAGRWPRLRLTGAEWGALALLVAGVATVMFGPAGDSGIPGMRRMAQHVIMLVAIASLLPSWRSVRIASAGLVFGMLAQVAVGLVELARGATFFYSLWKPLDQATWQGFPRIASTPADPNYFALGLVATLPAALALRALWPRLPSLARNTAVAAWLLLLWLTYSRAGYLGLFVLLAAYLATGGHKRLRSVWPLHERPRLTLSRRMAAMGLVAIPLMVAFLFFGLGPIISRLLTIGNPSRDASLTLRLDAQRAAFDVFLQHPIFGIGYDRFVDIGPAYLYAISGTVVPKLNVLDSFLLAACEGGIVAFGGFLFATLWSIRRFLATSNQLALLHTPESGDMAQLMRALGLGLVGWSVVSLSLDGIHSPIQWVLFGLAALVARCGTVDRRDADRL